MRALRFSFCAAALTLLAPAPALADPSHPEAQPQAPAEVAPEPPPSATASRSGGSAFVPAGVAFGLAAVGLGVGAVTGALSLSDVGTLTASCHGQLCPASERGAADKAKLLGNVSTASLIVGGAAALTGIAFLVLLPGEKARPAAGTAPSARAGLGLGRVFVEGTF
jgi:hypothetical protein